VLTIEQRFRMWFVRPYEVLQSRPQCEDDIDWNGAYVALAIGCMLCERYFRAKTSTTEVLTREAAKLDENVGYNRRFHKAAASHFGLSVAKFERFWTCYRNGVQHQGMPRKVFRRVHGQTIVYKSWISADVEFTHVPTEETTENEVRIKLNPWAFTSHIIQLFLNDPNALEIGFHHAFAQIHTLHENHEN
jgi:hypothetical protein